MKTKFLYIAALAVFFASCEKQEPFDTQSADDAPLILKPYNESGTGSFTYNLANPDTPLLDSVTVTPSSHTTVNWYLDGKLVYTGLKIEMTFPAGKYALTIEAETTAGKKTKRTGSVTVAPYPMDPYSDAPANGRHNVSGFTLELTGQNLTQVANVIFARDVKGADVAAKVPASTTDDAKLTLTMPELADGLYLVRLEDAGGTLYGANPVRVYNQAIVLDGYSEFSPGAPWVITGCKLADVTAVQVGDVTITELAATPTSVTFTAPDLAEGKYDLSMTTAEGKKVLFVLADGSSASEVKTAVSAETVLWTGPVALDWDAALVNITAATMDNVPLGSTILVYFEIPEAEYHNMRITTPWWGDDLVAQFDVNEGTPNPFTFTYDERCKGIVDMVGSWSIVGFGETINKISYK